ncbi:hypothetical protein A1A1_06987 [Planococcus antarcticus DSM 14505]|uniref:2'-5' RNA ligase n=1 Tax=Planococcus antarcticus DSM 14505 TaxID=1185653 RepID=A0AA87IN60_9BACL|nr:2'-5' RNA ligase family protein [Planococcus antarcticus]EIM07207.1 hypothetical protein A1A1_06987 [Planococcus antarcticus DSM 14505]
MQFFIGIVPPEEYKSRIIEFQQKWKNHNIVDAVEPHITLKAQGGLTPDENWINRITEVCKNFPTFNVSINEPKFFGEDILYLSAESSELFKLHNEIVRAVSPSKDLIMKYFELEDFTPHITLGKTYYGLSKIELKDMEELIEKELGPYPTFKVSYVRIYAETSSRKYKKYLDIQLKI